MNTKKASIQTISYSYRDIENICLNLSKSIRVSGFKPDILLGISVGGLVPIVFLSRLLGVKDILTIAVSSYTNKEQKKLRLLNAPDKKYLKGKSILIVDDICDSGNTIMFVKDFLKSKKTGQVKSATLFLNKKHHKLTPDYYAKVVNKWVVFPWDKFEKE